LNTAPSLKIYPIKVQDSSDLYAQGLFAIIPAFNQDREIGSMILQTEPHVERVIVIDDGSSDRTAEVAKLAGAEVIQLDHNTGKAYSVLLGLRHAYEKGCTVAVTLDADGQHEPREIQRVAGLAMAGKADLVIGSRFLERKGKIPMKQQLKQVMLKLPADTPYELIPTDPLSGFMAFSRNALENLDFPFEKTRFHENLIKHFLLKNLLIKEVGITEHPGNISKVGWDYSHKVIVALPAYNEEASLSKIIPKLRSCADLIIVVDDGSIDATTVISQGLGAFVIRHSENRGYGAALQTIFSTARDLNADVLAIMDADGQHNPEDVEKVLEPLLNGADVVIGSRFLDNTHNGIPKFRQIGMKMLDTATAAAGVKKGIDTQSGFRAYGKKAINVIKINGNGMAAGSEILIQIKDRNFTIAEVPINVRYDLKETSSQNPVTHGFSVLYKVIGMISYHRPLPAFGIPGFFLLIIGFFFGAWAVTEYYAAHTFPLILTMIGGVFVMTGLLLIIAALILNYLVLFVTDQKTTVPHLT
jgi:glycosyltransferase involved in cell wall biosynthesis